MGEETEANPQNLEPVPFLILAGGKGTRLGELSKDLPKALLEIGGEPFIAHVLRLLAREGVKKVTLLVHHFGEQIEAFVEDGSKFALDVTYCHDGQDNLGTGAAVNKALSTIENDFAVMYGDTYLDISMPAVFASFKNCKFKAMMTVLENDDKWQPSNVDFDTSKAKVLKYDKKGGSKNLHYVDYGLTFFSKESFAKHSKDVKKSNFDLGDIFSSMAKKSELGGYAVNRRFYDISTLESMVETRAYLSQNQLWQIDSAGKVT